jgi:hypothetical protein
LGVFKIASQELFVPGCLLTAILQNSVSRAARIIGASYRCLAEVKIE